MKTLHKYDVIVVGGGMVGAALACTLGDAGLKIAIIEGREPVMDWPTDEVDLRVSAITRASEQFLRELGAWQAIADERVSPYSEMHVWDAGGSGNIHFDCAEVGEPNLGHIIENRVVTRALWQRLSGLPGVQRFCPATARRLTLRNTIIGCEPPTNPVQLELDDGTVLNASLIVGADGGNSWVRNQAGIDISTREYAHTALVTTVKTERHHQYTAWQRFLPTGPLAFLPLTDGYSSIVWSTTAEEAARLEALDEALFKAELAASLEHKLGAITELGPRAGFPIRGRHARHYVKPHLALVGDAAHTIHPLAGQGVNLGFADAACLARELIQAWEQDDTPGSLKVLRRYERARRGDNLLVLEAMGGFKQLFGDPSPLVRGLRSAGLNLVDRLPVLKNLFIQQALRNDAPRA
ncbi:MAG: UbiH/UbiF/VisC/COQ6 family ubiquinone biosynthesis hydroxylase [Gammaproteobacteria bacterium]|nr:UbiH/UbiF/VisC/COQ6 family ubiquinone biosynthesis hydroxylase [Gammaproteobacteria bacterium]